MKFHFCGDGDCPDWILSEIISTLSVMPLDKLECLVEIAVKKICGEEFDELLVKPLLGSSMADSKSAIACIHFLLMNSVRYGVSSDVFKEEIQQLGLPNKHAEFLCQTLNKYFQDIKSHLKEKELKVNEVVSVQVLPSLPDDVTYKTFEFKIVPKLMTHDVQDTTHTLNIDNVQLKVLLGEMQLAYDVMKKYSEDSQ